MDCLRLFLVGLVFPIVLSLFVLVPLHFGNGILIGLTTYNGITLQSLLFITIISVISCFRLLKIAAWSRYFINFIPSVSDA